LTEAKRHLVLPTPAEQTSPFTVRRKNVLTSPQAGVLSLVRGVFSTWNKDTKTRKKSNWVKIPFFKQKTDECSRTRTNVQFSQIATFLFTCNSLLDLTA